MQGAAPDEAEGRADGTRAVYPTLPKAAEGDGVEERHFAVLVVETDADARRQRHGGVAGIPGGQRHPVGEEDLAHADGQEGEGRRGLQRGVFSPAVVAAIRVVP